MIVANGEGGGGGGGRAGPTNRMWDFIEIKFFVALRGWVLYKGTCLCIVNLL